MPAPSTDEVLRETLSILETGKSYRETAAILGISVGAVNERVNAAARRGITTATEHEWTYPKVIAADVRGTVLVGSDKHGWPGVAAPMWDAFLELAHRLRPDAIVLNGDVLDCARVSRHPRRRNSAAPKVSEEIALAKRDLGELPVKPRKFWPMGNHEARLDTYVANNAPELDDCALSLKAEFPAWQLSYGLILNGEIEIRHRWNRGIHAAYNNSLRAGVTFITGDTHRLIVTPIESRLGIRWGAESGMLADPGGPQFEYTDGSPTRWTSGFLVLTFDDDGVMLEPEKVQWLNGRAWFRGQAVVRSARTATRIKT